MQPPKGPRTRVSGADHAVGKERRLSVCGHPGGEEEKEEKAETQTPTIFTDHVATVFDDILCWDTLTVSEGRGLSH
jgi:hypothetical protein